MVSSLDDDSNKPRDMFLRVSYALARQFDLSHYAPTMADVTYISSSWKRVNRYPVPSSSRIRSRIWNPWTDECRRSEISKWRSNPRCRELGTIRSSHKAMLEPNIRNGGLLSKWKPLRSSPSQLSLVTHFKLEGHDTRYETRETVSNAIHAISIGSYILAA